MAGPNFTMARGWIAAVMVAAVAALLAFSFWPRKPAPFSTSKTMTAAVNAPAQTAPKPPPATLNRAEFLSAAAEAASAFASGNTAPELRSLIGRRFEVRIPFGCFGPSASGREEQAYWHYEEARGSITVGARVQQFTDEPWRSRLDPNGVEEAMEGFWIPRPWILPGECPQTSPGAPRVSAGPVVGLVALYGKQTARTTRRDGRPYEVTRPIGDGRALGPYALLLSGRITGFSDGAPFNCLSTSPDERPACLAGVEFSRIAIEVSASHEVLAEWAD